MAKDQKASGNEKRKTGLDRRSDEDRRSIYSLDYFARGGLERRIKNERRKRMERRRGWVRASNWTSISTDIPNKSGS
jgi:hypothetical protein